MEVTHWRSGFHLSPLPKKKVGLTKGTHTRKAGCATQAESEERTLKRWSTFSYPKKGNGSIETPGAFRLFVSTSLKLKVNFRPAERLKIGQRRGADGAVGHDPKGPGAHARERQPNGPQEAIDHCEDDLFKDDLQRCSESKNFMYMLLFKTCIAWAS